MSQVTVVIELEAASGAEPELRRILLDHAHRTVAEEPGCLRFELSQPVEMDGTPRTEWIVINELYTGDDAVALHRASPRKKQVDDLIKPLVKSRRGFQSYAIGHQPANDGKRPEELNAANDD
jgi:(4S)-4-hydroxy-5-phosphonooxypentane-2,3-dione isomerase